MDQQELMRNGVDGKADTFVIAMVMHLKDPDDLMQESRVFKSVVLDWFQARGATAEGVELIAVSDPKYHGAIKQLFDTLHAGEVSLVPVFEKVYFRLALHDASGRDDRRSRPSTCNESRGEGRCAFALLQEVLWLIGSFGALALRGGQGSRHTRARPARVTPRWLAQLS
jgi:hypothetical protein